MPFIILTADLRNIGTQWLVRELTRVIHAEGFLGASGKDTEGRGVLILILGSALQSTTN